MTRHSLTAIALAVVLPLAGCGGGDSDDGRPDVAKSSGELLSKTCPAPVDFETPAGWKVEHLDLSQETGEDLDLMEDLVTTGPFQAVCEVNPKAAGHLGIIRVHVAETLKGAPADVLAAYLEADGRNDATPVADGKAGDVQTATTTWRQEVEAMDEVQPGTAIAVQSKAGGVVITASGFDDDEFTAIQAGLELARTTLVLR